MLEYSTHLGDQLSVGSAEVVVTQPRLPCYKLGLRFQSDDMVKRFLASGRTGFYFAVTHEGEVGAGDEIKVIARDPNAVTVSEITRLYITKRYGDDDVTSVRRTLRVARTPRTRLTADADSAHWLDFPEILASMSDGTRSGVRAHQRCQRWRVPRSERLEDILTLPKTWEQNPK